MQISTKKNHFLNEALKLIHEKGYKATTMRDIAKRMNFDVSNSYNYVKSKKDILEIFLFKISTEFHDTIDNILDSNYDIPEKLKLLIKSHVQIASQKPYEVALLVNEWRSLEEPKFTEFITLRNSYEKKISSLLEDGIKSDVLKSMDLKIATSTLLGSIRWFYDHFTEDEATFNPIELERQIIEYVLGGLLIKCKI